MGLTPLSRVPSTTNIEYPKEMCSEEVECFMFSSSRVSWSAFQVSGLSEDRTVLWGGVKLPASGYSVFRQEQERH